MLPLNLNHQSLIIVLGETIICIYIIRHLHYTIFTPTSYNIERYDWNCTTFREVVLVFLKLLVDLILLIKSDLKMLWYLLDPNLPHYVLPIRLSHIHQHVCRCVTHSCLFIYRPIFVLKLWICAARAYRKRRGPLNRCHIWVIELVPFLWNGRTNESEIMPGPKRPSVYQYRVQMISVPLIFHRSRILTQRHRMLALIALFA